MNPVANLQGNTNGLLSATKLSPGKYKLRFVSGVAWCVKVITLGHEPNAQINDSYDGVAGSAFVYNALDGHEVIVTTFDAAGRLTDQGFNIMVICK